MCLSRVYAAFGLLLLFSLLLPPYAYSENESDVVVVVAIGPFLDLNSYTSSDNQIELDGEIKRLVGKRQPRQEMIVIPYVTLSSLKKVYDSLAAREQKKRVLLVIEAHGEVQEGEFKMMLDDPWEYGDWQSAKALAQITQSIPTETVLLSCHSGAAKFEEFSGPVFGISVAEERAAGGFSRALKTYLEANPTVRFPISAREWYVLAQRIPELTRTYPGMWWGPTGVEATSYEGKKFLSDEKMSANLPDLDLLPPDQRPLYSRGQRLIQWCRRFLGHLK